MKKILGIIALASLSAACFTACNDKPQSENLKAAVDSLNMAVRQQGIPMIDSCVITYDEATNTVKYLYYNNDSIDVSRIEPVADDMKLQFVTSVIANNHSLTKGLLEAKAKLMMGLYGSHDTKYEIMVDDSTFSQYYNDIMGKSK